MIVWLKDQSRNNRIFVPLIKEPFLFVDDTKLLLAKNAVCELVFNHVEQHKAEVNDENSREVLKMVCDMIVLVLTGGK